MKRGASGNLIFNEKGQKDYYPFGMLMPNRHGQDDDYRYGFNGHEKDDEVRGTKGASYDFGARMLDPRIGRWLSGDPLESKYPHLNPYNFVANMPIIAIDPDGRDIYIVTENGSFKLSKETLLKTETGKALWKKYSKSKTDDIYFTTKQFSAPFVGKHRAVGLTYYNIGKTSLVKGNKINIDMEDGNQKQFSGLNGVDVTKSKGKKISLITFNEEFFKPDEKLLTNEDKVNNAECIFHEMKSHIDLEDREDMSISDHKAYGKTTYDLFSDVIPTKGSPAEKITNELMDIYFESISTISEFTVVDKAPKWHPPMQSRAGDKYPLVPVPSYIQKFIKQ